MSVEVNGLTKIYGEQKAVNAISFQLKPGEIIGFLGPNGAGKSTTLKMITGYIAPDAGTIKVCGIDVLKNSIDAQKKMGYLPESNPLYYDMYVREFLSFIADIHRIKNKYKRIDTIIEKVGLAPERKKKIAQLSKGYKQRVGLAAAFIHEPEVLLLDEPTSGLDPNQIIEIRTLIKEFGSNKTVLFSSHILQEVEAICHRVIIINKGNIVADDTLSQLHQLANKPVVIVEFKEAVTELQLNDLLHAEKILNRKENLWYIQTANTDALKKELLQWAVNHQLNIVSLQNQNQSLEDIFKNLTQTESE